MYSEDGFYADVEFCVSETLPYRVNTNIPLIIIPKLLEGQFKTLEMAKNVAGTVVEGWKSAGQRVSVDTAQLRCPKCTFQWVAKLYEVDGRVEDVGCPGPGCGFIIKGSEVETLSKIT